MVSTSEAVVTRGEAGSTDESEDSEMGWGEGSAEKALALQVLGPEFSPQEPWWWRGWGKREQVSGR